MTRVVAVIPTIGKSPYLRDLCQSLAAEGIDTRVYVNSDTVAGEIALDIKAAGWDTLWHRPGWTIYQEWNDAAEWACSLDAHLLVLNDDIQVAPQFAAWMGNALDRFPEYALISTHAGRPVAFSDPGGNVIPAGFRVGDRRAFANWAFVARPEAWQMIGDYEIWYGDDDLIAKVGNAGWGVGYLDSVGVAHYTSTTTRQMPWTNEAVARDHARWVASGQG
jgi:hypothetical protein